MIRQYQNNIDEARENAPMERDTRQRAAIRDAIVSAQRPLLPSEVLAAAQAAVPGLGIATVYRNLKQLADDGDVRVVWLPGENARYEPAGHDHHHHFQCTACQRVFDVHACPGDLSRLSPPGFTIEEHDLTLYGRCKDCNERTAPRARRRAAAR
jgi:Fur family transcriptional regulator, ferric uptake regulator